MESEKRMPRLKYWIYMIIYSIVFSIIFNVTSEFLLHITDSFAVFGWSIFALYAVICYIFKVMLAEPRVRDYGGELKYTWLVFIPIVSSIYSICIGCYASK